MGQEEYLLGRWIAVLNRHRRNYVNRRLSAYGLSGELFILLLSLSHRDGASQEDIAARLGLDKATVARGAQALEKGGYIVRERSLADRRAYRLNLTAKGRALLPLIRHTLAEWEAEASAGLTEEERAAALRALSRMAENAGALPR